MKKLFVMLVFTAGTTLALQAQRPANETTEVRHIQLSLTPNVALHPRTTQINGLTLSIWGENPQKSVSLGFVNGSTGSSGGFAWGFVNYADSYTGIAWGLVNVNKGDSIGWQSGIVNASFAHFTGFQSGIVNYSTEMRGLQWGVVNYSERLWGVQIGLINVALNNSILTSLPRQLSPVFPFFNWSF